jgi:uncharacterized SAM-binding protein YcdF (DUF218 family)
MSRFDAALMLVEAALMLGAVWYSKISRGNTMFSTRTANTQHWTQHALLGLISGLLLAITISLVYVETKWYLPVVILLLSLALSLNGFTRRILSGLTLLVGFLLALCVFTPVLQPIQRFLDVTQLPSRADVIVILGGGLHCGSTDLESSSLARTTKGLELWKAGYAPTVTISDTTGLWDNCVSLEQPTRQEISSLEPKNPPEIVVLPGVQNTRMEAQAVFREAQKRGWKNILIVTAPAHSRRARATFTQLKLQAFVVSSGEPRYDTDLHLPHDRLKAMPVVIRELAGFVKYTLLGWF